MFAWNEVCFDEVREGLELLKDGSNVALDLDERVGERLLVRVFSVPRVDDAFNRKSSLSRADAVDLSDLLDRVERLGWLVGLQFDHEIKSSRDRGYGCNVRDSSDLADYAS